MMSEQAIASHKAWFDRERELRITATLVPELERTTNCGIGTLARRLFASEFEHRDVTEVIRLGLIGGGASPEEAASLIGAYVTARPLIYSYEIAVNVLELLWFGAQQSTNEHD